MQDDLDQRLLDERNVEMAAPHPRGRKLPKTQDGCKLRPYRRRRKVEKLFAGLQNFRRLVVRHEYHDGNIENAKKIKTGCRLCLDSRPVSVVSNATDTLGASNKRKRGICVKFALAS